MAQYSGPEACTAIETPLERLSCFDRFFTPKAQNQAVDGNNAWTVTSETAPVTGFENIYMQVASSDPVPVEYSDPKPATFSIRCINDVTSVLFWFGGNYMSDIGERDEIIYRLDESPVRRGRFEATSDNEYLGLLNGQAAIPFLRTILGGSTLLVRANSVGSQGKSIVASFPIGGIDAAIAPLREACHW